MARRDAYYVYTDSGYRLMNLETLVRFVKSQNPRPRVWSVRLSTGLLGLTGCTAGNRGPKKQNEVLLAVDEIGLRTLIDLGFITCPVCHPEKTEGFWETIETTVQKKYGITLLGEFIDKKVLPFDARRVVWEDIVPILKEWPGRLYVPKNLSERELTELKLRLERLKNSLPPTGYYDPDSPERFTPYFN